MSKLLVAILGVVAVAAVVGGAIVLTDDGGKVEDPTITWVVDGQETKTTWKVGDMPSFTGSTDKASTAEYDFTFAGWSPEVTEVTGNQTYVAQYSQTVREYTITWKFGNNETTTTSVKYGAMPSADGIDTTKDATPQYTYTFKKWDPQLIPVNGAKTYTALYDEVTNEYPITWSVAKGDFVRYVDFGTMPSYEGIDTTKPADEYNTYAFDGWEEEIVEVAGEATYTAKYVATPIKYTIKWVIPRGQETTTTTEQYEYNEMPDYGGVPEGYETPNFVYTFSHWDPTPAPVEGNETYTAHFDSAPKTSEVTWVVEGRQPVTVTYPYGAMPDYVEDNVNTARVPGYEDYITYTFERWEPTPYPVNGDQTYVAKYVETPDVFLLILDPAGGEMAQVEFSIGYGTSIDPANYKAQRTGHTFAGWNEPLPETMPAENVERFATWTKNTYKIAFDVSDRPTPMDTILKLYDDPVDIPDPVWEGHAFVEWLRVEPALKPNEEVLPANMPAYDIKVKAVWDIPEYDLKFFYDDKLIYTETVQWGGSATPPTTYSTRTLDYPLTWPEGYEEVNEDSPLEYVATAGEPDEAETMTVTFSLTKEGYIFNSWMEVTFNEKGFDLREFGYSDEVALAIKGPASLTHAMVAAHADYFNSVDVDETFVFGVTHADPDADPESPEFNGNFGWTTVFMDKQVSKPSPLWFSYYVGGIETDVHPNVPAVDGMDVQCMIYTGNTFAAVTLGAVYGANDVEVAAGDEVTFEPTGRGLNDPVPENPETGKPVRYYYAKEVLTDTDVTGLVEMVGTTEDDVFTYKFEEIGTYYVFTYREATFDAEDTDELVQRGVTAFRCKILVIKELPDPETIDPVVYDGAVHEPAIVIMDKVNGVDVEIAAEHFTVDWDGNRKDADTYTATVKAKEGSPYFGEKTVTFKITPKDLPADIEVAEATYDGTGKNPEVTIKDAEILVEGVPYVLEKDVDFTVTPAEGDVLENAGTYVITITGINNYAGESESEGIQKNFVINSKQIPAPTFNEAVFNNQLQPPTVTVKDTINGVEKTLDLFDEETQTGDYAITGGIEGVVFENADTYVITITGKNNYKGTATAEYVIAERAFPNIPSEIEGTVYNGQAQQPGDMQFVDIIAGVSVPLVADADYDIVWDPTGFVNAGTYTATVTPKGNYGGDPQTVTYVIEKAEAKIQIAAGAVKTYGFPDPVDDETQERIRYNVISGLVPGDALPLNILKRAPGEDADTYEIMEDEEAWGELPRNYVLDFGETTPVFVIKKRLVTVVPCELPVDDEDYPQLWKEYGTPDPTEGVNYAVKDGSFGLANDEAAQALLGGEDKFSGRLGRTPGDAVNLYDINLGDLTVVRDVGEGEPESVIHNYELSLDVEAYKFEIRKAQLPVPTVEPAERAYDGQELVPTITVKQGTETLVENKDYTVGIWTPAGANFTDVGVYEVELEGKGNYQGTRTVTYKITEKKLTIAWGDLEFVYNEQERKPTPTVGTGIEGEDASLTLDIVALPGSELTGGKSVKPGKYKATATLNVDGGFATNYELTNPEAEFEIVHAVVTIPEPIPLEYNGKTQTGVPEGTGFIISGNTGIDANGTAVGQQEKYTATLQLEDGYAWPVPLPGHAQQVNGHVTVDWSITPKPIAVTWEPADMILTYTGGDQAPTPVGETGVQGETADLTVDDEYEQRDVGDGYPVFASLTVTGGQQKAYNYVLTYDPAEPKFDIVGKKLRITPSTNLLKTYGDVWDPAMGYLAVGLAEGDGQLANVPDLLVRADGEDAGYYPISLTDDPEVLDLFGNYVLELTGQHNFEIQKLAMVIIPDEGQWKVLGEEDPELSFTMNPPSQFSSTGLPFSGITFDRFTGALTRESADVPLDEQQTGLYDILKGTLGIEALRLVDGVPTWVSVTDTNYSLSMVIGTVKFEIFDGFDVEVKRGVFKPDIDSLLNPDNPHFWPVGDQFPQPQVTVTIGETELTEGTHYSVLYWEDEDGDVVLGGDPNNLPFFPGYYYGTIEGIGDYIGYKALAVYEVVLPYVIDPIDSVTLAGHPNGYMPEVTVRDGETENLEIVDETNYDLTWYYAETPQDDFTPIADVPEKFTEPGLYAVAAFGIDAHEGKMGVAFFTISDGGRLALCGEFNPNGYPYGGIPELDYMPYYWPTFAIAYPADSLFWDNFEYHNEVNYGMGVYDPTVPYDLTVLYDPSSKWLVWGVDYAILWEYGGEPVKHPIVKPFVEMGDYTATVIGLSGTPYEGLSVTDVFKIVPVLVTEITLSHGDETMEVDDTLQLTETVLPVNATDKTVTWSSDNEDVAKVDQTGKVTAVGLGNATIKATANDGSGKYAECKIFVTILVTGINLNKTEMILATGGNETLTATVLPEDAENQQLEWSVDDNSTIVSVDQTGKVTAGAVAGTATVRATAKDDSGVSTTCVVTVVVLATEVTLDESAIELAIDDEKQLTETVYPTETTDKTVTWSSDDEEVAKVDQTGKVTAIGVGEATITVTTNDGSNNSATCAVTVYVKPTSVTIDEALGLLVDGSETLTATVLPEEGTHKGVTWISDNEDVAEVDENGKVTAIAVGTANITAKTVLGGGVVSNGCVVTVYSNPTGVKLYKDGVETYEIKVTKGAAGQQLTATVEPSGGLNPANQDVVWVSSNPNKVKVDQQGNITFLNPGFSHITARTVLGDAVSDPCAVTVYDTASGVSISPGPTVDMLVNGTLTLVATVSPAESDPAVEWDVTSGGGLLTNKEVVGGNYVITAGANPGEVEITATSEANNLAGTCTITLYPVPTGVQVNSVNGHDWLTSDTGGFTATVQPSDPNPANQKVTWESSNPDVLSVDENGEATVHAVGTTHIRARTVLGNVVSAPFVVNVYAVPETVTINGTPDLLVGGSVTLTAEVGPEEAHQGVTWELVNGGDFVNLNGETGLVEATNAGTATIKAKTVLGNAQSAEYEITVYPVPTGVQVNSDHDHDWLLTDVGGFTATVQPSGAPNPANQDVTWESTDPTVLSVNENGVATVHTVGTTYIRATTVLGGKASPLYEVNVYAEPGSVELSPQDGLHLLFYGSTGTFTADVSPGNACQEVTWHSSDPDIAEVSNEGVVSGVGLGTVNITAKTKVGNVTSAEYQVTVYPKPTDVTLDEHEYHLLVGSGAVFLDATVLPNNPAPNTANQSVEWISSNPDVVTIGKITDVRCSITAAASGTTHITAKTTLDSHYAKVSLPCVVRVYADTPDAVAIDPAGPIGLSDGGTQQLTATVTSSTGTDVYQGVTWETSNPGVASVDGNGLVTANAIGNAVITVKTIHGGIQNTVTINVS